jgi:hypothetical protein
MLVQRVQGNPDTSQKNFFGFSPIRPGLAGE